MWLLIQVLSTFPDKFNSSKYYLPHSIPTGYKNVILKHLLTEQVLLSKAHSMVLTQNCKYVFIWNIIKIRKYNANTKLPIDAFHIFLKTCSTNYTITKKATFKSYLFQFFTAINNYKKRIIKEKPVKPWQLNQGAMVPTQQKAMASLCSAPKMTLQLPRAPVGTCCQHGASASARLQDVPCSHARTAAVHTGVWGVQLLGQEAINLQEEGCPGKWWSDHPWRYLEVV